MTDGLSDCEEDKLVYVGASKICCLCRDIPDMENWYSKIVDKKDVTDPFVDVKLGK